MFYASNDRIGIISKTTCRGILAGTFCGGNTKRDENGNITLKHSTSLSREDLPALYPIYGKPSYRIFAYVIPYRKKNHQLSNICKHITEDINICLPDINILSLNMEINKYLEITTTIVTEYNKMIYTAPIYISYICGLLRAASNYVKRSSYYDTEFYFGQDGYMRNASLKFKILVDKYGSDYIVGENIALFNRTGDGHSGISDTISEIAANNFIDFTQIYNNPIIQKQTKKANELIKRANLLFSKNKSIAYLAYDKQISEQEFMCPNSNVLDSIIYEIIYHGLKIEKITEGL